MNMTAEEFFIKQFNKCTWIGDKNEPGNIFMVYDKHHERKIKMNSILNEKKTIPFIKTEDTVTLFYQDYKNDYLYCDYSNIWSVFRDKYNYNLQGIRNLVKGVLDSDTKLNVLTPKCLLHVRNTILDSDTKLNVLTPAFHTNRCYK